MKTSEALTKARELLHPKWRFTGVMGAMDRFGQPQPNDSPEALRFDIFGAMQHVCEPEENGDALGASCYEYLVRASETTIATFRDHFAQPEQTWEIVIDTYDKAIRMAKADGR
jgi:hypothetical protein